MKHLREFVESVLVLIRDPVPVARSMDATSVGPTGAQFLMGSLDQAPKDLYEQAPFEFTLLRRLKGPDRPDYWLAEVRSPLRWQDDDTHRTITHLVLAARIVGETIENRSRDLVVGIAFVIDPTLATDAELVFTKVRYVAVGIMQSSRFHPGKDESDTSPK